MTLQEFAEKTGMDLSGTLARFANMESLLVRFLKKFGEDPSFQQLSEAVTKRDFDTVERAAHTLKGVAGNLGFQKLLDLNQDIVDAVRKGDYDAIDGYFDADKEEYRNIIHYLEMLD